MRRFGISILFLIAALQCSAQSLMERSAIDALSKTAKNLVLDYNSNLENLGNPILMDYEKEGIIYGMKEGFDGNDVLVFNDLDPMDAVERHVTIEQYLSDIKMFYGGTGLKVGYEIDRSGSKGLYTDRSDKFLFVKVVVKKTLKGRHLYEDSLHKTIVLDHYVQFKRTSSGRFSNRGYIYSIVPHEANQHTFKRVLAKGESLELTVDPQPSTPISQEPEQVYTAPKPTPTPEPVKSQATQTDAPCQETDHPPYFNSSSNSKESWKNYYQNTTWFKDAIDNGIEGQALAEFIVTKNGQVQTSSLNVQLVNVNPSGQMMIPDLVEQIIVESTSGNNGWIPATEHCNKIDAKAQMTLSFKPDSCRDADHKAWFNGAKWDDKSNENWMAYLGQSESYRKAIVEGGLTGWVRAKFILNRDNTINSESIQVWPINAEPTPDQAKLISNATKSVIMESQEHGSGWTPALKDCQNDYDLITQEFRFAKKNLSAEHKAASTSAAGPMVSTVIPPSVNVERFERNNKAKCDQDSRPLSFNRCIKRQTAWREYVKKHPAFIEAVLKHNIKGRAEALFAITSDGKVRDNSVTTRVGVSVNNKSQAETAVEQIVLESQESPNKWYPAKHNGRTMPRNTNAEIWFRKEAIDPADALASGFLEEDEERKMARKKEWRKWKNERLGGVHFSYGFRPMYGTVKYKVNGTRSFRDFPSIGGSGAFGGLFGQVFGMELFGGAGVSPPGTTGFCGLNLLFNASPLRWRGRFLFNLGGGMIWIPGEKVRGTLSLGLLCLDVKLAKGFSMYFDFAKGSLILSESFSAIGYLWTPGIGFRAGRW